MTDRYPIGQPVPLTFEVFDSAGDLADAGAVALTITLPNGSTATPTLEHPDTGVYLVDYTPSAAGVYTARFVATGANAGAVEDVFEVVASNLARVTVADLRTYLGDTSATDDEITDALAAETAAQVARCCVDPYTADLRQALMRRVARNLAARAVPVATFTSFEGGGTSQRVPKVDAEVARLEGPYQRWAVG